jgi:hypothetical protein
MNQQQIISSCKISSENNIHHEDGHGIYDIVSSAGKLVECESRCCRRRCCRPGSYVACTDGADAGGAGLRAVAGSVAGGVLGSGGVGQLSAKLLKVEALDVLLLLDGVLGMESHRHDISSPCSWGILSHFSTTAYISAAGAGSLTFGNDLDHFRG